MITAASVQKLKPQAKRVEVHDANGLYLVIQPSGKKSWAYRYRVNGKSRKLTLGRWPGLGLAEARKKAAEAAVEVHHGVDPIAEQKRQEASTLNAVLDDFVRIHVSGLRSGEAVARNLSKHVRPRLGERSIYELRRSDIASVLNKVAESSGPVAADRLLAYMSKAFNWHAVRDDNFVSPIVRGMARTKPIERARRRVLDDQELRDLWRAVENIGGSTERYLKALLLTACRRTEVSDMRADELVGELWIIPAERYKTKQEHVIPLTDAARRLIRKGFDGVINFSLIKRRVDAEINRIRGSEGRPPMLHWTFHDLRRTARSLMSRAGVDSDVAERCLGHTIAGVRGTYDRYKYLEEKREAFETLAGMVETILNPPADNLVALRG
jgi:integrase